MSLNSKQIQFAHEYVIDRISTQAAIRAGYSVNCAHTQGSRLFNHVEVKALIFKLIEERSKETKIDAAYVLKRVTDMVTLDPCDIFDAKGNYLPIREWPLAWRQSICGFKTTTVGKKTIVTDIKWVDRAKMVELLGKHIDVSAFSDNLNVTNAAELSPWGEIQASVDKKDESK